MESSRRLAAIMFTDIVGYTALMGENEEAALNLLARNRTIHKSIIAQYQGEWLKEMGDGTLASFNTSTDAVLCGAAIQSEAKKDGITLRIGIHIGEVVFEDHDVFGDGVNISSRIESIAPPGSIWVSESVHNNVHNKKGIETKFVKEAHLKNVRESLNIYEAKVEGIEAVPIPAKPGASGKTLLRKALPILVGILVILALGYFGGSYFASSPQPKEQILEKSIAVLPFKNESPNDENEYFCNGIMEGILDQLSKIPDLSVVSRTSVEQYRKNPPSTVEIAKQLEVNYIVEGSVFRVGNNSKITAQLIYAPEDRHIWSDQFDKNLEDIFSVLSEVTKTIADTLRAKISPEVLEQLDSELTVDVTAYDYYLQAEQYKNNFIQNNEEKYLDNSEQLYQAAINLDSTFALAYTGQAFIYWMRNHLNFYKDETKVDTVLQLCNKAIALDPMAADAYHIRGSFYDHIMVEIDKAEHDFNTAIELNPNHVDALRDLANLYVLHRKDPIAGLKLLKTVEKLDRSPQQLTETYLLKEFIFMSYGDFDKGREYFLKAQKLSPLLEENVWFLTIQGKLDLSLQLSQKWMAENNRSPQSVYWMGLNYLLMRNYNQALDYFKEWENKIKGMEDTYESVYNLHRYGQTLVETGKKEEGISMMKNQFLKYQELKNFQAIVYMPYDQAGICAFLGEKEKAYEYLRKLDETSRWDMLIYFVQIDPLFDNIREDEEFKAIIGKVLEENRKIREEIARLEAAGEL